MILPINNGNETHGETLVVDFESELFDGSVVLRIRHSEGTTKLPYDDSIGYFAGMNRRYQAVISGKFKKAIPITECTTGFVMERPAGKLPPKWLFKSALRVVSFFAPQLSINLEGDQPYSLTPLGSTPQCVIVSNEPRVGEEIAQTLQEPMDSQHTLTGQVCVSKNAMQRSRFRKRHFDKLYTKKSPLPISDPSKVYTFEFLQHLFNFEDFSIELGNLLGSVHLAPLLDGQPLQVMAQHNPGNTKLWSFDIWHESLVADAASHDQQAATTR